MSYPSVIEHLWSFGKKLVDGLNDAARAAGVGEYFKAGGYPCSPVYWTLDAQGQPSPEFRTLFLYEMMQRGISMWCIALCYRHGDKELKRTLEAAHEVFGVYRKAIDHGVAGYLKGDVVKPVFRKFN